MWDILSDRFVRQSPSDLPVFGFIDGTDPSTVFSRIELNAIRDTNRQFVPVRVKNRISKGATSNGP